MNLLKKIKGWFTCDSPPMMDPKLISGVHVAIDFTITTDAEGLAEALKTVSRLREHILRAAALKSLHMGQMVELCGPLEPEGEHTMQGILHALTPAEAEVREVDAFGDRPEKKEDTDG